MAVYVSSSMHTQSAALYFKFIERAPTLKDCEDYFADKMSVNINLCTVLTTKEFSDLKYVDHNLFALIFPNYFQGENQAISTQRQKFIAICTRRNVQRSSYIFISHSLCTTTLNCSVCRKIEDPMPSTTELHAIFYCSLLTEEVHDSSCEK